MAKRSYNFIIYLAAICAFAALSYVGAADRMTWWLEATPALIAVLILATTRQRFPLTNLVTILIGIHCIILLIGAHYTYANVPAFNWLRDAFDLSRNHYDRLGHFVQGFIPAMIARELLLRTSPLRHGAWLFTIITLSILGVSAAYELVEWLAAVLTGEAADAFLGSQGDVWDSQKDMMLALLGAITAQLSIARFHDRQLAGIKKKRDR